MLHLFSAGNFPWITSLLRLRSTRTKRAENLTLIENTALSLVKLRRQSQQPAKVSLFTFWVEFVEGTLALHEVHNYL